MTDPRILLDRAQDNHVRAQANQAYCEDTSRMAEENFLNLLPWRWPRWFRTYFEIRRRLAYQEEETAAIEAEVTAINKEMVNGG